MSSNAFTHTFKFGPGDTVGFASGAGWCIGPVERVMTDRQRENFYEVNHAIVGGGRATNWYREEVLCRAADPPMTA